MRVSMLGIRPVDMGMDCFRMKVLMNMPTTNPGMFIQVVKIVMLVGMSMCDSRMCVAVGMFFINH
jgi:hypothetical protein